MGISEWRHDAFPKLPDSLRINIENVADLFQQEIDNTAIDPIWKDVLQRVVVHEKMTLSFHYSIGEYPYHIMVTLDTNENDAWICKVPSTWQPTYDAIAV